VDDQEAVRLAIARLLGGRGHEVVTAGTGAAALTKLREEYFDVLLCDVRLPEMSGLEILSQAMLLDRDLPVLMLSGASDVATAREALKRGAMDYLTKPIELDDLDLAVRSAG
jgi:DNA-binding NtrC family response regulator